MTDTIRVVCLLDRYWDYANKQYGGTNKTGTLIDVSVRNSDDKSGNLIPVGIVKLDDGNFQSVPMEFIHAES